MTKKKRSKSKSRRSEFRFEVKVERDTVLHDLAQQSLDFDHADRDMLYYTGNLAQMNDYDTLKEDHAIELRKERAAIIRRRRLGH